MIERQQEGIAKSQAGGYSEGGVTITGICMGAITGLAGFISKGAGEGEGEVVDRTVARSPPSRKPEL